jgi:hypothetical protein
MKTMMRLSFWAFFNLRPALLGGLSKQIEIVLRHLHVDLNGAFHALLYLPNLVVEQRDLEYAWYLTLRSSAPSGWSNVSGYFSDARAETQAPCAVYHCHNCG